MKCSDSFGPFGRGLTLFTISTIIVVVVMLLPLQETLTNPIHPALTPADISTGQGARYFRRGRFEEAIPCYIKSAKVYEETGDREALCRVMIELSRAYQSMGKYRESIAILERALVCAPLLNGHAWAANIPMLLGNAFMHTGNPDAAGYFFHKGLERADRGDAHDVAASILNAMGNMHVLREDYAKGADAYRQGLARAERGDNRPLITRILANLAHLALREQRYTDAKMFVDSAYTRSLTLDHSHETSTLLINIATTYRLLDTTDPDGHPSLRADASNALQRASDMAEANDDKRSLSYALGYIGQLYEDAERYDEALHSTQRAVFAAQEINALDSLYLWHWQSGRLYKAMGKIEEAITAYRKAVDTLESIRHGLASRCDRHEAASFRESIEPVYFGLADLLLQYAVSLKESGQTESCLIEARETIELLRTAELRDFFHDPCLGEYFTEIKSIDVISDTTAVLYIIPLDERVELLLSLHGRLARFSAQVKGANLRKEAQCLRNKLEKRTTREYLIHAQRLYDWLIRPVKDALESTHVETLVCIPDGAMRGIPLAALHDGDHFLVERYATANAINLTLTDPRPIKRERVRILMAGISDPIKGFPALAYVDQELHAIQGIYDGRLFLNRDFCLGNVTRELRHNPYSIVHIASHGIFTGDAGESCLIAWDGNLSMDDLDTILGPSRYSTTPVELLTMSACETAAGDERAALGLAGVAIKAGTRSTLATLWHIDDRASSELIAEFYRQLKEQALSKAQALQKAQLRLINDPRYKHPCYWSPFIIIGNWL
ncbi:MAG: CHAT domain-containing protein [bacterium]